MTITPIITSFYHLYLYLFYLYYPVLLLFIFHFLLYFYHILLFIPSISPNTCYYYYIQNYHYLLDTHYLHLIQCNLRQIIFHLINLRTYILEYHNNSLVFYIFAWSLEYDKEIPLRILILFISYHRISNNHIISQYYLTPIHNFYLTHQNLFHDNRNNYYYS